MAWKDKFLFPAARPLVKGTVWGLSRARLPQVRGTLRLGKTGAPVEVLRDRWGVPHIYAASLPDAVFGQGFVHAQERLWQMDFSRRAAAGRLAEIMGAVAVGHDRGMHTLGFRRVAEEEERRLPQTLRPILEAYCAGVNAWLEIAIKRGKLPVEFSLLGYRPEPWQLADTLSWPKMMSWTLAANWESEFLRGQIVQRVGPEKAAALELSAGQTWAVILDAAGSALSAARAFSGPGAGQGVGSNNWVVHGTRTATGLPLLANDMHLGLSAPSIWFENHLRGGELEVSGVSLPGVPLVVAGHNRAVAWGFTDGIADVQDLYEEHLRRAPGGGWEAEFKGRWEPAQVRAETIRVKNGPDALEEVILTRHGPVINLLFQETYPDVPPLALRWPALEPETTLEAFYGMNLAGNCAEFRRALRAFDGPAQNVVFADTRGEIGYQLNGKVPVRPRGDGSLPVAGWTGEDEWLGYIPFEEMPQMSNPPRGLIVTANNPIHLPDYPRFIGRDFCAADRAGRITEMLRDKNPVDVAYFQKMHVDQVSLSARALAQCLGRLEVEDADLREITRALAGWNGKLNAGSWEAAVYEVTMRQALRMILSHHLQELGVRVQGKGPAAGLWGEHTWEWFIALLETPASAWFDLGHGERRDDVLRAALRQAVDFLQQQLGPVRQAWAWGKLHQLTFAHIFGNLKPLDAGFSVGPLPVGGDNTTIWASKTSSYDLNSARVVGPPFRFIADLGDLDHCLGALVPGQSGHPGSRHYADGVAPWFAGEYHPMLFQREEIERQLEAKLIIE